MDTPLYDNNLITLYKKLNTECDITPEWFNVAEEKTHSCVNEIIPSMIGIAENLFPGHWDLQVWPYEDDSILGGNIMYAPLIVIKFDEITITNTNSNSNIIRDLYISIPIYKSQSNRPRIDYICGTRGRLSDGEHSSGYLHSHLSSFGKKPFNWQSFCLGTDAVSTTIVLLNDRWSVEKFEMLMHQMAAFALWESLEGTPYTYISNISIKTALADIRISIEDIQHVHELVNDKLYTEDFDIIIEEGRYKVVDNKKFETALKKIVPTQYWVRKGSNGKCYAISNIDESNMESHKTNIVWKGKKLRKVPIYPTLAENNEDKVVDQKIKRLIIKRIEARISQKIMNNGE